MVSSFRHTLNAQGQAITASPDGSTVYVGGDFTTVDGVAHNHIAAFNTATGTLISGFKASVNSTVRALAATNTELYAGGAFMSASGQARSRLAAFSGATGVVLPWAPTADDQPLSMVIAPDGSRVIVGGKFLNLNGAPANGMGSLDASTGATMPWAANTIMHDGGTGSGIDTLRTDGTNIYGAGYAFQTGDFEGSFSADPDTGNVNWLNDCHGDTYDVLPVGQVLYTVSHAHNCSMIGAFPQSNPWSINMRHALAYTTYPTGVNSGPDDYGWNYAGQPDSTLLQWFPVFSLGNVSGANQAAWSLTGNSQYVAAGGEFPRVNGVAQQGLVRFAVKSIAPNKVGPTRAPGAPTPSAMSITSGTARVSWQSAYDQDNANLTYNVYRSGTAAPVYTTTQASNYWTYPMLGFVDKGLTPGSSYTYSVKVSDPFGNTITLPKTNSVTIGSNAVSQYSNDVTGDGATAFWRLGEPSGSAVYDYAGFNDATAQAGVTRGVTGPISGDSTTASTFDGSSADGSVASNSTMATTPSFSVETWVKTNTTSGGKIVGYGSASTGNSGSYDRHIYMDNAGHFYFGVYPGSTQVVSSPKTYNDGSWHYVVASLDPTAGMTLYVDGKKVASNPSVTSAQDYSGYWRIGGDNLNGWPNQPSSNYFAGTIGDVAIYPTALTLAQIQTHYTDGGGSLNIPAAPKDAYGKAVYNSDPELFWRLDDATGPTAADASRNGETGVYSGGETFGQPGALGSQGTAVTFNGVDGTIGSADQFTNPTVYSEELWFNTTTTNGGKLIGFGDQQSGNSNNYDRHVYMTPDGKLNFGVYTGATNIITSPASYNDGKWHYMVATQGPDGMTLYVDGQVVATGTQTQAQSYTGYWRVGGDTSWSGNPFFAGSIDEVAVYSSELDAATVQAHYAAAGGTMPNQPPVAAFTVTSTGLTAAVDGSGSSDPDGTVSSYDWTWGDGTPDTVGASATASHTYAAAGQYTVSLTVTDNGGAPSTPVTHSVTVTAPPVNQPPVAAFTVTSTGLTAAVDGSGSSDPDGTVSSYDWTWGDGTPDTVGASATASHTYAAAGQYTVSLTVTDNDGAPSTPVTHSVTVTAPVGQAIASDSFNRTVANGWGSADVGGAWTRSGAASNFAVSGGQGSITMATAGSGPSMNLNSVSTNSADITAGVSVNAQPTGSGVFVSVMGRTVPSVGNYRATLNLRANGSVTLGLFRVDGAGQAVIVAPTVQTGLTYSVGDVLNVQFLVTGTSPTTLSAKVWKQGTTEPTAWGVSGTDGASAMQAAGSVGLMSYLGGSATIVPVTTNFTNFQVQSGVTPQVAMKQKALRRVTTTLHKSKVPSPADRVSPPLGLNQFTPKKAK
ncbi:LamG-like jellyroll fold domain-containing protein [Leekyejoonella antrihumi]|uniref:LamG-like jellyroll fold domain-containing protein n=1 Tax=Leekyejoonella antrihumi TaxID=1660198 RepID=UPI001FECF577|nr:LamG-like jellyroll fold domain-containing protein [Leekyejoonella antrihumi]